LGYTRLVADAAGVVTATGAEPGEVVQAGRMIVQLARQSGRDAVFDVPPQLKDLAPANPEIVVALGSDSNVTANGRVREVAPRADPATGTFRVRVGLTDPPAAMRLGTTVIGRMVIGGTAGIEIPASALSNANRQPAVWVVDPKTETVSARNVEVLRFDQSKVILGSGLAPGELVVTAGVRALRPGQKVRLLGGAAKP
jgi:RND family efflux transporter MFP subunit